MVKVNTNKQSARKFLRNNAAIIATILLFVVILSTLLIARYGSLYSIRDIANINPLITTENAELIAVNVNGVIKIIKDDDGSANDSDKKSEGPTNPTIASNQQPGTAVASPNNNGTNGATPRPSSTPSPTPPSPSPSTSPGPIILIPPILSPSPTPSPSEFRVSVQSKSRTNQRIYDVGFLRLSCKNDSTLQIRVRASSGAGSAKVQWKFDDKVVKTDESSLKNMASGDTRTSEAIVMTDSFGIYSITADIVNVNGGTLASTDITFSHTCI